MEREISLDEMKKIMLEILDIFDKFCRENSLRYYLAYGTLIGAVRHKGFIPWDDDIDVVMPRPDYNRFMEITREGLNKHVKVYSIESEDNYIYPFAKVVDTRTVLQELNVKEGSSEIGIYIDVFPIDGMPDGQEEINKHYGRMKRMKKIFDIAVISKNQWGNPIETLIKRTIKGACSLYGHKRLARQMDRLAMKYDFNESEKIGVILWGFGPQEVKNKADYVPQVFMEFEGRQYPVPANYHDVLTHAYGDYMQLPPVEKRVSHHTYRVYWKETH